MLAALRLTGLGLTALCLTGPCLTGPCLGALPPCADEAADAIDFGRDVRPILAEHCFACHGPDEAAREGGLRLDTEAGATRDRGGYRVVDREDPAASELLARIESADPDELMPPPAFKHALSAEQRALLAAWVASGADYERHWAFVAPEREQLDLEPGLAAHPIDAFVERALGQSPLELAPEADARTLARRLHLDVIGLPPSPEAVEAFARAHAKDADAAVAALVDELLASPQFGEKWARGWLDLARYADSNGFQADQLRPSWAYRDWVVRALNDGMPFDQFTIEQLAGDLLPEPSVEQRIATGFHRATTCNVEAGVHAEANRVNQVFDRVNTTATVWLGLTLECAQCHDHKYDPFSTEEYYSLFAYFNNTPLEVDEPSGVSDVQLEFSGPYMALPLSQEQVARRQALRESLSALEDERASELERRLPAWLEQARALQAEPPRWQVVAPSAFHSTGEEEVRTLEDGSTLLTGPVPDTVTHTLHLRPELETVSLLRLEALTHPELPGSGPGRGDPQKRNFILNELVLHADGERVELSAARADFSQNNWPVAAAIDGAPDTGWAIAPQFGAEHWIEVALSAPVRAEELTLELHQNYGRGRVLGRVRVSVSDADPAHLGLPADLDLEERAAVEAHVLTVDPALVELEQRRAATELELAGIRPDMTLVMQELDEARPTHVMQRGDYLQPGTPVRARTPAALHPQAPEAAPNRLALAEWIVDDANPLTARVVVNRWWEELFGRGLVATPEDFGTQASPPSHPGLLDWLALELVESGWDMRHVLRAILSSHTYRRDSRQSALAREQDPWNERLARGPRFRLPAEAIRDAALAASGLLSSEMYGPPVMPYQPPKVWRAVGRNAPVWTIAEDEDRYRRGLYVVWRRAAPYPSFVAFDAPDRASCSVRRPRTNTPLQALALLNDPVYVEAALALADRGLTEAPADPVGRMFALALSRSPSARERALLEELRDARGALYASEPEAADALVRAAVGLREPRSQDTAALAACFHVAQVLFNLDEFVTKG